MDKCLYTLNVEYLKKRSSNVSFDHIMTAVDDKSLLEISTSSDGRLTFEAGNESKVQIHSRRDPEGEAVRQVESWIEKEKPSLDGLVIAPGFGGMYHLKELASRLLPGGMLLVAEKFPCMIRKALDFCDMGKLACVDGSFVIFIASESAEELKREYRHYLQTRKDLKVSVFMHPGLSRAFPGGYEELVSILKDETVLELMERNTKIILAQKWLEHAICNIPALFNSPFISGLKDRYASLPALVVAAGPSLDESAGYIAKIRDKVLLIAVGRAMKPLAARGITPDFVVHIDSDFKSMLQFESVNSNDVVLLSDVITYPGVVSMFRGRCFFFASGAVADFEKWLKVAGLGPERLCVGGTVALSALDAARFLGCRQIFFMGLDLAFNDDGTTHAKGSKYKVKEDECGRTFQVKGNYKDTVFTSEQFRNYIKMINSYLADACRSSGVAFYNVTTQGAALENCELLHPVKLEELLADFSEITEKKVPAETASPVGRPGKEKLLGHIKRSIEELKDAAVLVDEMIGVCSTGHGKVDYNNFDKKAAQVEADIKKMELANMLVAGALQGLLFKTMARGEVRDGEEAQKVLKEFYSNYKGACEWVSKLLSEAGAAFEEGKDLTY